VDVLFERSHAFRLQATARFPELLRHVLGMRGEALPPPEDAAEALQALAWECLQRWHAAYGLAYRPVLKETTRRLCLSVFVLLLLLRLLLLLLLVAWASGVARPSVPRI
jgi:hypothetical protein